MQGQHYPDKDITRKLQANIPDIQDSNVINKILAK